MQLRLSKRYRGRATGWQRANNAIHNVSNPVRLWQAVRALGLTHLL